MPSRHIIKVFAPENYYHIYNRGVDKQNIFKDNDDHSAFLNLFKRHLSEEPPADRFGRPITKLHNDIELLAFCLMPNHFHLLVYNISEHGLTNLMRRTMTAYSMYFNKRHGRVGTLFQDTYKASMITDDTYLWHISRYIHLNPQDIGKNFEDYPYSSYRYFMGDKAAEWIKPDRILELHNHKVADYRKFVKDYEASRKAIQEIKYELADH